MPNPEQSDNSADTTVSALASLNDPTIPPEGGLNLWEKDMLSDEIFMRVFWRLIPEDILALRGASKRHARVGLDNVLWEGKFNKHFPREYNTVKTKHSNASSEEKEAYWFAQFGETYKKNYRGWTNSQRRFFSAIKEESLDDIRKSIATLRVRDVARLLFKKDTWGNTALTWSYEMTSESFKAKLFILLYKAIIPTAFPGKIDIQDDKYLGKSFIEWLTLLHIVEPLETLFTKMVALSPTQEDSLRSSLFLSAIKAQCLPLVEFFLPRNKTLTTYRDSEGATFTHLAVRTGALMLIPEQDPHFDTADNNGYYPAHEVAHSTSAARIFPALVAKGLNPNMIAVGANVGETPLLLAIIDEPLPCLSALLANGANTRLADAQGFYPIHHAANLGVSAEGLEAFIRHDSIQLSLQTNNPEAQLPLQVAIVASGHISPYYTQAALAHYYHLAPHATNAAGLTGLESALAADCNDVVEIILKQNLNFASLNPQEQSLLHLAAIYDRSDIARTAVISLNLSPNNLDQAGNSPAFYAKSVAMIETLEALDTDFTAHNTETLRTPLHHFCATDLPRLQLNDYPHIITRMILAGVDPMGRDKEGNTALHHLISRGIISEDVLNIFIAHCQNPHVRNNKDQTVLHALFIHLCEHNIEPRLRDLPLPMMRHLIKKSSHKDAGFSLEDDQGYTPLFYAIQLKDRSSALEILKHDPTALMRPNKNGLTAFARAIQREDNDFLGALLRSKHVDLNSTEHNTETVLTFSIKQGHEAVATMLLTIPTIDQCKANRAGETPLQLAIQKGMPELIAALPAAKTSASETAVTTLANSLMRGVGDAGPSTEKEEKHPGAPLAKRPRPE